MSHYRGETNSSHKDPKNHRRNGAPEELSRRFKTEDAYGNMGRTSPKVKEDDGKNHDLTSVVKTQVKTQKLTETTGHGSIFKVFDETTVTSRNQAMTLKEIPKTMTKTRRP